MLGAAAALLALSTSSCAGTASAAGIYVAGFPTGAPGWIGEPGGLPAFSPVGGAIAWGGEDGLFLREAGASVATRLSDRPVAGRVSWSPDGRALAFVDRTAASLVVLVAATREMALEAPISNPSAAIPPPALPILGGPSWSPDGTRLAFDCWDGHGDELCLIKADGSQRRQVTAIKAVPGGATDDPVDPRPAPSNVGPAAWSPDGSRLAVAAYPEQSGATAGVFLIDLRRNSARRISPLLPSSELTWSVRGDAVAFAATSNGRSDVLEVATNGDAKRVLTEALPEGADDPALFTGSTRLAVNSGAGIVIMDGDRVVREIDVPGLRAASPSWSHDGSRLAFVALPDPIASYG
ncbi:MAG: PD40 domain-containing protein [Thermomicrobiales bacterium]|nr:PD40 domain-containing protein [Thermomicrobiales bacterium]